MLFVLPWQPVFFLFFVSALNVKIEQKKIQPTSYSFIFYSLVLEKVLVKDTVFEEEIDSKDNDDHFSHTTFKC